MEAKVKKKKEKRREERGRDATDANASNTRISSCNKFINSQLTGNQQSANSAAVKMKMLSSFLNDTSIDY